MSWFRKLLACLGLAKKAGGPKSAVDNLSPEQKAAAHELAKVLAAKGVSVRELAPDEARGPEMEVGKDPL